MNVPGVGKLLPVRGISSAEIAKESIQAIICLDMRATFMRMAIAGSMSCLVGKRASNFQMLEL